MVARKGDFKSATECCTVNCSHHWSGKFFNPAKQGLDSFNLLENLGSVLRSNTDQCLEVTAGEESLLATGHNHTGDRVDFGLEAIKGFTKTL